MDIATLPNGLGQDFANGRLESRMIVGDDQFHAVKCAAAREKLRFYWAPRRWAAGLKHAAAEILDKGISRVCSDL
jgi:hypothetical protein